GAEPARRFTELKYRANGVGYTPDRRAQVFVADVPRVDAEPAYPVAPSADEPSPAQPKAVPEAVQLTEGDADHGGLSWLPDGRLAFIAARHESRDTDLFRDVYAVEPV